MKRWHRSMKRKPKAYEDIIVIYKKDDEIPSVVELSYTGLDENGKFIMTCGDNWVFWDAIKNEIKQWAYIDKYFEKELKCK